MGLLVGLPLGIFRLLAGIFLLALRLAVPIALAAVLVWFLRRSRRRAPPREGPKEPRFDGPVYTVDYREEEDDES